MKHWCKIIEVLDNQVLFYMEPESRPDDKDCYCLHQVVMIDGVCSDIKVGGIPSDTKLEEFLTEGEKLAETIVKLVEDLLEKQKK